MLFCVFVHVCCSYDQRSGTGKFTMADGTCYEGDWEDDKATG
jgi:hypothetical protein